MILIKTGTSGPQARVKAIAKLFSLHLILHLTHKKRLKGMLRQDSFTSSSISENHAHIYQLMVVHCFSVKIRIIGVIETGNSRVFFVKILDQKFL